MGKIVLIDSGPIVAALRERDQHHAWARSHFDSIVNPCLTCEAVVSESFFLLEGAPRGKETLCGLLERGIIVAAFQWVNHRSEVLRLIRRYSDTPMSFADACLVRMAEIHDQGVVFTTDTDFQAYRMNGRQTIPTIAPW